MKSQTKRKMVVTHDRQEWQSISTYKENIHVSDIRRKETKNYKGTRTFKRKEGQ
jgi:hypothetical protein